MKKVLVMVLGIMLVAGSASAFTCSIDCPILKLLCLPFTKFEAPSYPINSMVWYYPCNTWDNSYPVIRNVIHLHLD